MAETLTFKASYSEASKNNASVSLSKITIDDDKLKTLKKVLKVRRKGYMWCSCGGSAQSVTILATDTLTDGTVEYGTASGTVKVHGTGPTTSDYVLTEMDISESSAATMRTIVAALKAGTLSVKRTLSIKSYTSSSHGNPYFRTTSSYTGAYLEIETLHSASNAYAYRGGEWVETEVLTYRNGEWVSAGTGVYNGGEWKE